MQDFPLDESLVHPPATYFSDSTASLKQLVKVLFLGQLEKNSDRLWRPWSYQLPLAYLSHGSGMDGRVLDAPVAHTFLLFSQFKMS